MKMYPHNGDLRSIKLSLVKALLFYESKLLTKLNSGHQVRGWNEESQTETLAILYAYAECSIDPTDLPVPYQRIFTEKYNIDYNRYKELALLDRHIADSDIELNRNGFFSCSKYATQKQPYGPYSDHCCYPTDGFSEVGVRYSKLKNR